METGGVKYESVNTTVLSTLNTMLMRQNSSIVVSDCKKKSLFILRGVLLFFAICLLILIFWRLVFA